MGEGLEAMLWSALLPLRDRPEVVGGEQVRSAVVAVIPHAEVEDVGDRFEVTIGQVSFCVSFVEG